MAKGDFMELDTREFEARIALYDPAVRKEARAGMTLNGEDLLRESKALIAVDEGTLMRSGSARTRDTRTEIETSVGFNTPYATKVHYDMAPAPGSTMKQGPITRTKPATEFGEAGGLYLQRPLLGKMQRYFALVAKRIKQNVSKGS